MMPGGFGDNLHQIELDFNRVFMGRQSKATRNSAHMGIHHNPWNTESGAQNDVGGFTPNTGQINELLQTLRDLPAMDLQQFPGAIFNIFGFVVVKSCRPYKPFYVFNRGTGKVSWGLQVIEHHPNYPVNLFVGTLS